MSQQFWITEQPRYYKSYIPYCLSHMPSKIRESSEAVTVLLHPKLSSAKPKKSGLKTFFRCQPLAFWA